MKQLIKTCMVGLLFFAFGGFQIKAASLNNDSPAVVESETVVEQKKSISGTVKDSKGITLPGVSIVAKGTTIGTITDDDGKFQITVPVDTRILVFSFVGMKTQEIAKSGNNLSWLRNEGSCKIKSFHFGILNTGIPGKAANTKDIKILTLKD